MSKSVLCIGATLVDELYFCDHPMVAASSNPAQKTTAIGGVMSNIVQHLALLEVKVSLLTALGNDADGVFISAALEKMGIDLSESVKVNDSTGKYMSILNPDGSLYVAVCQDISSQYITVPLLESKADYLRQFDLILIDTNLAAPSIQWLIDFANKYHKKLIIEPVSVPKATKLADLNLNGVFMITPNEEELLKINTLESDEEQTHLNFLFRRGVANLWLRKGSRGSVIYQPETNLSLSVPTITIVDTTGAGDAALAGWVFGHLQQEEALTSLQLGHTLAFTVLQTKGAVDSTINKEKLYQLKQTYYHD
jgi:pseudouridine kinase